MSGWPLFALGAGSWLLPATDVTARRLRWLADERLAGASERQLVSPAAPPNSRVLLRIANGALLAAAPVLAWLYAGAIPAALAAATGAVLAHLHRSWRAAKQRDGARAELAQALGAVVAELEAGAGDARALRTSAAAAGRYRRSFERAGDLLADGADELSSAFSEPELALVSAACAMSSTTGAPLAVVLRAVRDDLYADQAVGRSVATVLAGPRSSSMLLAGLPLVGLGLGYAMGGSPLTALIHTGWGLSSLAVGTCLDLSGLLWTQALARRAAP